MWWIKLLVAIGIVAFSLGLGYLAAGKARERSKFYLQMHDFNERYLAELGYARKPLPVFLREYPAKGEFRRVLDGVAVGKVDAELSFLDKEERKACADYFSMLGRGDAASQTGYFGGRREELSQKHTICEKQAKERSQLSLKLGLLAGLAFVILII